MTRGRGRLAVAAILSAAVLAAVGVSSPVAAKGGKSLKVLSIGLPTATIGAGNSMQFTFKVRNRSAVRTVPSAVDFYLSGTTPTNFVRPLGLPKNARLIASVRGRRIRPGRKRQIFAGLTLSPTTIGGRYWLVGCPSGAPNRCASVALEIPPAILTLSPTSHDFSSSPGPATFTITNVGAGATRLSRRVVGPDANHFKVTNINCPTISGVLQPGQSCASTVGFSTAHSPGAKSASFSVGGSPGSTSASASLTGFVP